jgi:hypothetical protein
VRRLLHIILAGALALASLAALTTPSSAQTNDEVADAAVVWLATQQQADGGFEVGGLAGFETPDATLAIAAAGQTDDTWSTTEALTAVEAIEQGGNTALDALDDYADTAAAPRAQAAAKLLVLAVLPLGLNPNDFDPSDDSASAVDLEAELRAGAGGAGDYAGLAFNGRLFAALALALLDGDVPDALLDAILAAQQDNGGWNFEGDPADAVVDPDTTGLALQALVAAGAVGSDPVVRDAVALLALALAPDGSWASEFDDGNPNSTAYASLGITAAGGDVGTPCWRDAVLPAFTGVPYRSPDAYQHDQQATDGHIAGPSDSFGVTTFASSQAVQGLLRRWLPPDRAAALTCPTLGAETRYAHAVVWDALGRLADDDQTQAFADLLEAGASRATVARFVVGSRAFRVALLDSRFEAYLGRSADRGAIAAFEPALARGRRVAVEASIVGSPEYFAVAGGDAEAFIDAVYVDVLGRTPDAGGKQAFLAALDRGATRGQVARALLDSAEGRAALVRDLYGDLLRRRADAGGLRFWTARLAEGVRLEVIVVALLSSPEYAGLTRP